MQSASKIPAEFLVRYQSQEVERMLAFTTGEDYRDSLY
jgi:hypothetical protein